MASRLLSQDTGVQGAVTRADLRTVGGQFFVRREDLLNPDLMSEVILLAAGVLVFVILLLILVVALTHPALV
jgi:hypothetical protein